MKVKKKLSEDVTLDDLLLGWTRCCYLLPNKKRLCNCERVNGSNYCGNHRPIYEVQKMMQLPDNEKSKRARKIESGLKRSHSGTNDEDGEGVLEQFRRVVCPIDGSHTIYLHSLEHHVEVCTKRKQIRSMEEQVYYCHDCNSGAIDEAPESEESQEVDLNLLRLKLEQCYDRIMREISQSIEPINIDRGSFDNFNPLNIKQDSSDAQSCNDADNKSFPHWLYDRLLTSGINKDISTNRRTRHIEQDVLILEQIRRFGLLKCGNNYEHNNCQKERGYDQKQRFDNTDDVYVELGAGRGLLGYAVRCANPDSSVILVERAGSRKKAERQAVLHDPDFMKAEVMDRNENLAKGNKSGQFLRVRMDIRHCNVGMLPGIEDDDNGGPNSGKNVVLIAKHLCGAATDLAIRSMNTIEDIRGPKLTRLSNCGIAIATCCHHRCVYSDYVGKQWLRQQGFTEADFNVLKVWSSWSSIRKDMSVPSEGRDSQQTSTDINNCEPPTHTGIAEYEDDRNSSSHDNQGRHIERSLRPKGLSRYEMGVLGWKAKRVIDEGRVEYIKSQFPRMESAQQIQYCGGNVSLENVMLIASTNYSPT